MTVGELRKAELEKAAQILGFHRIKNLGFYDGNLHENQLPLLSDLIAREVDSVKPDVIIIYERTGISLHLDHIAVSKAVIDLFDAGRIKPQKIYYFGLDKEMARLAGGERAWVDSQNHGAVIDVSSVWQTKLAAIKEHKTQGADIKRMLKRYRQLKNNRGANLHHEHFQLARTTIDKRLSFPESDLLAST